MARGDVDFSYISTDEMLADMFTKPVPGNKLQLCCDGIGVGSCAGRVCMGVLKDMLTYQTASS